MIEQTTIDAMFKFSGVNKEKLHEALKKIGNKYLRSPFKVKWTKGNPTIGYGYVISEFVYYYIAPKGSKLMKVYVPKTGAAHWFIQWPDAVLVDLAIEQFKELPAYEKAKEDTFTDPNPSFAARRIAEHMGFTDDDIDE